MDIRNDFTVPLGPAETWRVLLDIRRIMPCVPGAELIEVLDAQTYKGKVSVKLGPVALAFVGTARFEELDEAGKRATVLAKGSDAKGRGGANAVVALRLEPVEDGTKVFVETNVTLTGSVAQYGRGTGVIQGVASQLTAQFAQNLKAMLANGPEEPVVDEPLPAVTAPVPEMPSAAVPVAVMDVAATVPAASASGADGAAAARAEAAVVRAELAAARVEAAVGRVEAAVARVEAMAVALAKASRPLAPPVPQAKPISGVSLMLTVLWGMLTGLFSGKRSA